MTCERADALESTAKDRESLRRASQRIPAHIRGLIAAELEQRITRGHAKEGTVAALVALGPLAIPHIERALRSLASLTTLKAGRVRWSLALELSTQWAVRAAPIRRAASAMLADSLRQAKSDTAAASWMTADAILDLLPASVACDFFERVLEPGCGRIGRKAVLQALFRLDLEGRTSHRTERILRQLATANHEPSVRTQAEALLARYPRDRAPTGVQRRRGASGGVVAADLGRHPRPASGQPKSTISKRRRRR